MFYDRRRQIAIKSHTVSKNAVSEKHEPVEEIKEENIDVISEAEKVMEETKNIIDTISEPKKRGRKKKEVTVAEENGEE